MTRLALLFAAALVALAPSHASAAPAVPQDPYASPNLLVNRDRLDEVARRRAAGDPVMTAAWDQVVAEADARLHDVPHPVVGVLKIPDFYVDPAGQQAIARPLRSDASSAYALAMAHALTGDPAYAAKAREFVFAWVNGCTRPEDGGRRRLIDYIMLRWRGDTPLVISYTFPQFIGAIDLLEGDGALQPGELAQFRSWLRVFVAYHTSRDVSPNNHLSWQVVFLMSAAHILRDPALLSRAVGYYRFGFQLQVLGDGAMPLELVRGEKAATYTLMNLEALCQAVHLSEVHGVTGLRGARSWAGGDLRDAVGFLADFIEDPRRWRRYTPLALDGPLGPGDWGWAFELPRAWWGFDPRYAAHTGARPYGIAPPRCYTTGFATLSFAE